MSHAARSLNPLARVATPRRIRRSAAVSSASLAGPNEVLADLLGLGEEQVVRLHGSRVEVIAPPSHGGGVLLSLEVGTDARWPGCDLPFHGQDVLRAVGHEASRVAVVGRRIAVSTVHCSTDPWSDDRGTSAVTLYELDGTLVTRRVLPDGLAVTALDGAVVDGVPYLALGLSRSGVRVVRADRAGLPDHDSVPADWRDTAARGGDREIVMAVAFGSAEGGRAMLVCASITGDGTAVVATDVLDGRLLWSDNVLSTEPLRDHPTSIAVGPFGDAGVPTVSVAWSSGQLTLHDASRGTRPYRVEPQPDNAVTAQSFVTGHDGDHWLAIRRRRDARAVLVSGGTRQLLA